jgi:protein MAK11
MTKFWIVCGSYEHTLHGYRVEEEQRGSDNKQSKGTSSSSSSGSSSDDEKHRLIVSKKFGYSPHIARVSCVSGTWPYVVSGSADESVRMYSLKSLKELGHTFSHSSTISRVSLASASHMLTSGDDGSIHVWRTRDWQLLTRLGGHQGAMVGLAVHPSGKALLSSGRDDRSVRLWNLTTGLCVHKQVFSKRDGPITDVQWSGDEGGRYFAIVFGALRHLQPATVVVYDSMTGAECVRVQPEHAVLAVAFIDDSLLAVAGEDAVVRVYSVDKEREASDDSDQEDQDDDEQESSSSPSPSSSSSSSKVKPVCVLRGHERRIAALASIDPYLISASTDGSISIWDLSVGSRVRVIETGAHITCMTVIEEPASYSRGNNNDVDEEERKE